MAGPLADLGVLAIVAAKLGFAPVTGVDLELPALEARAGTRTRTTWRSSCGG